MYRSRVSGLSVLLFFCTLGATGCAAGRPEGVLPAPAVPRAASHVSTPEPDPEAPDPWDESGEEYAKTPSAGSNARAYGTALTLHPFESHEADKDSPRADVRRRCMAM